MLELRPYQIEGRDFLAERRYALLADEMRVGKTPQAILAADKVGADRILVVCPAIACAQWKREFARWSPSRQPATIVRQGSREEFSQPIVIVSYDMLRRHAKAALAAPAGGVLVVDECHYVKNPKSARTKVVLSAQGIARAFDKVWLLSGTPAQNHAAELWPLLRVGGRTTLSYGAFVEKYCVTRPDGSPRWTRADAVADVRTMLAPIMLRRTRRDVAPHLPPVRFSMLPIDCGASAASLTSDEFAEPTHENVTRWIEERSESLAEARRLTAIAKAQAFAPYLFDLLATGALKRTVVFAHHREALDVLMAEARSVNAPAALLRGGVPDQVRVQVQDLFRAGELPLILANITAAGTAIDLSAADHGFFLELDWSAANNVQAASRLVALTKAQPVSYDIVTAAGSIDEAVQATLARKTRDISKLYASEITL